MYIKYSAVNNYHVSFIQIAVNMIFQSVYSFTYLATGICGIGFTDTATEVTT